MQLSMISVINFSMRAILVFEFGAKIKNLITKTIAAYSDLRNIFREVWMLRNVEQGSKTDGMKDDHEVGKETRPKDRHGTFVDCTAHISNAEEFFINQMGANATDKLGRQVENAEGLDRSLYRARRTSNAAPNADFRDNFAHDCLCKRELSFF
jgi:hypothetical protein